MEFLAVNFKIKWKLIALRVYAPVPRQIVVSHWTFRGPNFMAEDKATNFACDLRKIAGIMINGQASLRIGEGLLFFHFSFYKYRYVSLYSPCIFSPIESFNACHTLSLALSFFCYKGN
jgi:hypothetical protein